MSSRSAVNPGLRCLASVLLVIWALSPPVLLAETPSEHDSHHPESGAAAEPESEPEGSVPTTKSESMDIGPDKSREFYPALMELGELSPATRRNTERLARERMSSGIAHMSSGLERLQGATAPEDLKQMEDAMAQVRQGIGELESGAAALRALFEGKTPREISLNWFRESMSLPTGDTARPHGVFGLTAFHYFSMFLLVTTVASLLWMNFQKMRRSRALVTKLAGDTGNAPLPAQPPASPSQLLPGSIPSEDLPSKPNSWTGLLRVVRVFEETPNVRTLRLASTAGGDLPFRHLPGQFVTFTVKPIDQSVKRSYTIASSPTRRDFLEVTVKREEYGTVSSFLHGVHEGDTIQVTGPSGTFTFVGEGANSIVLISGGVGVTPMMSVLRYLTDRSWSGDIFFIYGCRSERDVIYREELEYLHRRYSNLKLAIVAEEAADGWPHARGRITSQLLGEVVPHIRTRRIHLCGPPAMMTALKSSLTEMGVPPNQVKTEVFIGRERPKPEDSAQGAAPSAPAAVASHPMTAAPTASPGVAVLTFARSRQTALLSPDKTVLEASEDVGVNIDYSCRVGVCGLCKVKLLSGSVSMAVQDALDANDRKDNVILACQAKSQGDLSVDA